MPCLFCIIRTKRIYLRESLHTFDQEQKKKNKTLIVPDQIKYSLWIFLLEKRNEIMSGDIYTSDGRRENYLWHSKT